MLMGICFTFLMVRAIYGVIYWTIEKKNPMFAIGHALAAIATAYILCQVV
jgi:hypothetical protein